MLKNMLIRLATKVLLKYKALSIEEITSSFIKQTAPKVTYNNQKYILARIDLQTNCINLTFENETLLYRREEQVIW